MRVDRSSNLTIFSALLLAGLTLSSCSYLSNDSEFGSCDPPPALAASATSLALSCAEEVTLDGTTYSVGGGKVHKSWVGDQIAGGGESNYQAAYRMRGFSVAEAIVLQRPDRVGGTFDFAVTNSFKVEHFGKIAQPFVVFPVQDQATGLEALLEGKLVRDKECLFVLNGGSRTVPVWPPGFSYAKDGNNPVEVLDSAGEVVAEEGQRVALGGGALGESDSPVPAEIESKVEGCPAPFWIVSSVD